MAVIETLFKITASVAGANAITSLGQEIAKVSTQGENLQRKFAKVGNALKLFAIGEGASLFGEWIKGALDTGVQLDHISQKTGVSVEALGHLKGAAEIGGTSLEDLGSGLEKFDKAIIQAQSGTSRQAAAFDALGINIKDANGNIKPTAQLLGEVEDAFHDSADGAGKTAVALDLFGKTGANLIPTLNLGKQAVDDLGLSVGKGFAEAAEENEKAMIKIHTQFEQAAITISSQLLPGLTSISEGFGDNNLAVQALIVIVQGLEIAFVGLEEVASQMALVIGNDFADIIARAEQYGDTLSALTTFSSSKIAAAWRDGREMRENIDAEANAKSVKVTQDYQNQIDKILNPTPIQAKTQNGKSKGQIKYDPVNATKGASEAESAQKAADKWLLTQQQTNQTLAQQADYIGKTDLEIQILKSDRELDAQAAVKSIGLTADQASAFMTEEAAVKRARDAIIQHNYELSRTALTGATEYLKKYSEDASNSAAQVKQVFGDTFKGLEDALTTFVTTGKLSFSSLVTSIITDLARISIQRSITGPLADALGGALSGGSFLSTAFANGGIMSSAGSMPLNMYAGGGIATGPQVSVFGEGRVNEAYVPLPDGKTIPVTMKGSGGDTTTVSVAVNMAENGGSTTSSTGSNAQGQALGRSLAAAIKATLIDEKRPGGILAS
jgi:lambda family phage tail tape measure protein